MGSSFFATATFFLSIIVVVTRGGTPPFLLLARILGLCDYVCGGPSQGAEKVDLFLDVGCAFLRATLVSSKVSLSSTRVEEAVLISTISTES